MRLLSRDSTLRPSRSGFACEIKNYDWTRYFDRKEVRKYDPFVQYALIAAAEAVSDARLDDESIDRQRCGVIWSSGVGGIETYYNECMDYAKGGEIPRFSPFFVPRMIADLAAGHIAMKYGFMGPNYCVTSACASSNHAIIDSLNAIRLGKADIVVTGGSEAAINVPGVGGFSSMQALSTRNDDPAHASRPFDADRDGFVIGRGCRRTCLGGVRTCPAARCAHLLRGRRRRYVCRRLSHDGSASRGCGCYPLHARSARRRVGRHRRHRLHQRPRHVDPSGRYRRVEGSRSCSASVCTMSTYRRPNP